MLRSCIEDWIKYFQSDQNEANNALLDESGRGVDDDFHLDLNPNTLSCDYYDSDQLNFSNEDSSSISNLNSDSSHVSDSFLSWLNYPKPDICDGSSSSSFRFDDSSCSFGASGFDNFNSSYNNFEDYSLGDSILIFPVSVAPVVLVVLVSMITVVALVVALVSMILVVVALEALVAQAHPSDSYNASVRPWPGNCNLSPITPGEDSHLTNVRPSAPGDRLRLRIESDVLDFRCGASSDISSTRWTGCGHDTLTSPYLENDSRLPCLCDAMYVCSGSNRRRYLSVFAEGFKKLIEANAFSWRIRSEAGEEPRVKILDVVDPAGKFVRFEVEFLSGCFQIEFCAYGLSVFTCRLGFGEKQNISKLERAANCGILERSFQEMRWLRS